MIHIDPHRRMSAILPVVLVLALIGRIPEGRSATANLSPGDLLVTTLTGGVFRVDPKSGNQQAVSRGGFLDTPFGICVSTAGDIYVADANALGGTGAIVRVDPASGSQSVVSSGGFFSSPGDVVIHPNGDLFVVNAGGDGQEDRVIRVDPMTGQQTSVAAGVPFVAPAGLAVLPSGDLLVADFLALPSATGTGAVFRVHLADGRVDTLTHGQLIRFIRHVGVSAGGRIMVSDLDPISGDGRILEIDPVTGTQSILASGGALLVPEDLEFLGEDSLLVVARDGFPGLGPDGGVLKIDVATGAQDTVTSRQFLGEPFGLAVYRGGATPALQSTWGSVKAKYRR
ncbi:MAG: hypothetical protein ACREOU_15620 [Candidatus Eiseniibacteriota bacterium]